MRRILSKIVLILAGALSLQSCVSLAPDGVRDNRLDFNRSIHETNDQQLLLNVVRSHNYENPIFTNVVEQDIQTSASAGVMGGSNSINAIPALGLLTGTITVSQAPTDKILVPYGADIINQYDTPISMASINHLYQSNFPIVPTLALTIQRLTPGYSDYGRAIDLIAALDSFGAVDVTNDFWDTLIITLRAGSALPPSAEDADHCFSNTNAKTEVDRLWTQLNRLYGQAPKPQIVLNIALRDPKRVHLPIVFTASTRTALGAIKEASEGDEFKIADRATIDQIIAENETKLFDTPQFYYIRDQFEKRESHAHPDTAGMWGETCKFLITDRPDASVALRERSLRARRAFVLIVRDARPQPDAFTSVAYRGEWYSVLDADTISKHNLSLLATILTIEAKPSENPATPTVLALGAK